MNLRNRLTGKSPFPEGAFFFIYDYWMYDEGAETFKSLSDGSVMPDDLLVRLVID